MGRMLKSNNTILITGGLGYIGNEIIEQLIKKNFNLIINDFSYEAVLNFYPIWHNKITYIHEDVCNLSCPKNVDLIIHLAAEVGYIQCEKNESKAIRTNIEGTKNIASFNKPTIFFSSGSVYGKLETICTEKSKCYPETLYAKTKKEGEDIIIKNVSDFCILRPATAFGISYKTRHDLLVHDLSNNAAKNKKIDLYQPNAIRTIYHVKKIAKFISFCIENWKNVSNETFNLGNETGNLSKIEIVKKIAKHIDLELNIINKEDPDQRDYEVDYSKIKKIWKKGAINTDRIIENIAKYYKLLNETNLSS